MNLESLANDLAAKQLEYSQKLAVWQRLMEQLEQAQDRYDLLQSDLVHEQKAHGILLALEELWRKDFEEGIEKIITEAMHLVFKRDAKFQINVGVKAGTSAIEFVLVHPDGSETEIDEAEGGSILEISSFLLRVIMVKAAIPQLRLVILLDEPFQGVDDKNMGDVADLLRKIVDESGIQIIMVTHDTRFVEVADKVVEIKDGKVSA